jgi:hypothetical protein
MIRKIKINIDAAIAGYVPVEKRDVPRIKFLRALLVPFTIMMGEFIAWRDVSITRARVTVETASIEWYLNQLFTGGGTTITIETAGISGVTAGVEVTESGLYIVAGVEASEAAKYKVVGMTGEGLLYGTASFVVNVPNSLAAQKSAIVKVVNQYRLAGKTFKIVFY